MIDAYFLSHNGLGDNIFMSSAVNYLTQYYKNIYVLCKNKYMASIIQLYKHNNNIKIIPFDESNEFQCCYNILIDKYDKNDIFVSGGCYKSYLTSKITHPELNNYKIKHEYNLPAFLGIMENFYYDINLDLSIYSNNFKIEICEDEVINQLKNKYKLIFVHTESSTNTIDLSYILDKYINREDYLIICANKNYYSLNDEKYELVNKYIKLETILDYCYIIVNSEQIYAVDSCFSCLIYGLLMQNKIDKNIINFYDRNTSEPIII